MRFFYLTCKDILQIHEDAIIDSGGGHGMRDEAGIESAIAAPILLMPTTTNKKSSFFQVAAGETNKETFTEWVKFKIKPIETK